MASPVGSASKPQQIWLPWSSRGLSQSGLGRAPAVERHRDWGYRAKQLRASIADSQRIIGLEAFRELGERWTGTAKKPKSFWEPAAKPRQERAVVPRSSAPTGRFSFPSSKKTALARASAYRMP